MNDNIERNKIEDHSDPVYTTLLHEMNNFVRVIIYEDVQWTNADEAVAMSPQWLEDQEAA